MSLLKRVLYELVYKKQEERDAKCMQLLLEIRQALATAGRLFENKEKIISEDEVKSWLASNERLITSTDKNNIKPLRRARSFKVLKTDLSRFADLYSNFMIYAERHNKEIEENERKKCMSLLSKIFHELIYKKQEERDAKCMQLLLDIRYAIESADKLFVNETEMVLAEDVDNWLSQHKKLANDVTLSNITYLKKAKQYRTLTSEAKKFYALQGDIRLQAEEHNKAILNARVDEARVLIGKVENSTLDKQQMLAIVKNDRNHLVIAGAGTGKTTTIVGKVKYLLMSGACDPSEILVLSFTNASAAEMAQRIQNETKCNIAAMTFHKFGLEILAQAIGKKPNISELSLSKFIVEKIQENLQDEEYLRKFFEYVLKNRVVEKSEFDFTSLAEYTEYLKLNPPTTMRGETVKSYGEMNIANFLHQNGVEYIYENPYEHDTRDELDANGNGHAQYKPDFYLPEYGVYIEYFGINRNGEVPAYFRGSNTKSPSQLYRESINWKRDTHKQYNTKMLECYAYENMDGILEEQLKNKLQRAKVNLRPKTIDELQQELKNQDKSVIYGVAELFGTVITLMKGRRYTLEKLRVLSTACGGREAVKNALLLDLIKPILNSYQDYLQSHNLIDFDDMINMAADLVVQGKYQSRYRYVIVDEYQDISFSRYDLLKKLREIKDYSLFCVGDDWQSIYRFAGSDVGYILNFEKYWGVTEISKIETTYRFGQNLIDVSGDFVMQNPNQFKKNISGKRETTGFCLGEIQGFTEKNAVDFSLDTLRELPKNSSVYYIGRFNYDGKRLEENPGLKLHYNNEKKRIDVYFAERPDLNIQFITAHKSKGLQADYVFILNNKKGRMGFPSQIQDDPILNYLLENSDTYPHAEERRLFYVAMTRARKKVFLMTQKDRESDFVKELHKRYGDKIRQAAFECPICGGKLVPRSGKYGDFYGCSNYKVTGCRFTRKVKQKREPGNEN